MRALEFWKVVTVDEANLLERFVALLEENAIRYCVVGGQGVNAYAEPVVSLDLDLAVATDQLGRLESLLGPPFQVEHFPHSLNVSVPGSDLRIQIQTDPRYGDFVKRATKRPVLGLDLPVSSLQDLLQGKIWAVQDETRRPSKRQKDLADISRLLETHAELRGQVPPNVLERLLK